MRLFRVSAFVGTVAAISACIYVFPAFVPEERIRESLLAKSPVGSTKESVLAMATKEHWDEPLAQVSSYTVFRARAAETPVTAYTALMRYDPFPFDSRIVVICEFDDSERLYDLRVRRVKLQ